MERPGRRLGNRRRSPKKHPPALGSTDGQVTTWVCSTARSGRYARVVAYLCPAFHRRVRLPAQFLGANPISCAASGMATGTENRIRLTEVFSEPVSALPPMPIDKTDIRPPASTLADSRSEEHTSEL